MLRRNVRCWLSIHFIRFPHSVAATLPAIVISTEAMRRIAERINLFPNGRTSTIVDQISRLRCASLEMTDSGRSLACQHTLRPQYSSSLCKPATPGLYDLHAVIWRMSLCGGFL